QQPVKCSRDAHAGRPLVAVGVVTPKPRVTPRARPSFHTQNTENLNRPIKNRLEQHKSAHENPWSATHVRILKSGADVPVAANPQLWTNPQLWITRRGGLPR